MEVAKTMMHPEDHFFGADFPSLALNEIHLWTASYKTSKQFINACQAVLSDIEKEKLTFFLTADAKESFILSHGGIRLLLSYYLQITPSEIKIGKHTDGKPYSIDAPALFFNLSHAADRIVFAFSKTMEVGIDMEKIRHLEDLDLLIEDNFNNIEKSYISADENEKLKRFFIFWTVKEAYLKAIGKGMLQSPKSITFSVEQEKFRFIKQDEFDVQDDWTIHNFQIEKDYIGTLMFQGDNIKIREMKFI